MKSKLLAISFGLALSACTTMPQFVPAKVGQTFEPRTPPDKIELFRSQVPTKPFLEIGSSAVCCHLNDNTLSLLKQNASRNGGDAIIGLDIGADGSLIGTVIRYQ